MIANHVHDALAQVRRLQEVILEKRRFGGYSGRARIASGSVALVGAWLLAAVFPAKPEAHLVGWGVVLAVALVMNYGALAVWFFSDPGARRNRLMLKPAIDAVPALAVGAILTVALVAAKQYDLLPGTWMCLYGLAQVAYRQSLPQGIYIVGLAYMACGAGILLSTGLTFLNPWPMGAVFFAGELAGGLLLISNRKDVEALA
ncbi:MAG: hypothetical protein V1929_13585 [bacterium]